MNLLLLLVLFIMTPTYKIFLFQYLENEAYEEELKRYEDKERADLDKARLKAQEAVSH